MMRVAEGLGGDAGSLRDELPERATVAALVDQDRADEFPVGRQLERHEALGAGHATQHLRVADGRPTTWTLRSNWSVHTQGCSS